MLLLPFLAFKGFHYRIKERGYYTYLCHLVGSKNKLWKVEKNTGESLDDTYYEMESFDLALQNVKRKDSIFKPCPISPSIESDYCNYLLIF